MTTEEKIAELEKDIGTLDFIMARCTSDSAYRIYSQNRDERAQKLRMLRDDLKREAEGLQPK